MKILLALLLTATISLAQATTVFVDKNGRVFGYESNGWVMDEDSELIGFIDRKNAIKAIGTGKPLIRITNNGDIYDIVNEISVAFIGMTVENANVYVNSLGRVFGYEKDGWVMDENSKLIGFYTDRRVKSKKTQVTLLCISPDNKIHDYINEKTLGPVVGTVK